MSCDYNVYDAVTACTTYKCYLLMCIVMNIFLNYCIAMSMCIELDKVIIVVCFTMVDGRFT